MRLIAYPGLIKPIRDYVDIYSIETNIQKLTLGELLTYLGQHDIIVWRLAPNIFIALDFEAKHKNNLWVSLISTPASDDSLLELALETAYGVKIYSEQDLRNILKGLIVHREYLHALSFILPCESEVRIKKKGIVGVADAVCNDHVVEIKTGRPEKSHAHQLLIYMDLLQKPYGILVYRDSVYRYSLHTDINLLEEAYRNLHEARRRIEGIIQQLHHGEFRSRILKKYGITVGELIERLSSMSQRG